MSIGKKSIVYNVLGAMTCLILLSSTANATEVSTSANASEKSANKAVTPSTKGLHHCYGRPGPCPCPFPPNDPRCHHDQQ